MIIQPKRILCVSNRKVLIPSVSEQLEEEGIAIQSTNTAAEGYELARDKKFTILLFSDRLRKGAGIEPYRRVRNFDQRTPAIIVISDCLERQIEKARALRAQIVSSTPVKLALLLEIIRKLMPNVEERLPGIFAAASPTF